MKTIEFTANTACFNEDTGKASFCTGKIRFEIGDDTAVLIHRDISNYRENNKCIPWRSSHSCSDENISCSLEVFIGNVDESGRPIEDETAFGCRNM